MKKKPKISRTPKPKFSGFPMSNPQFGGGGKFFQHAGELAKNYGLAVADAGLSTFGMTNVVSDNNYSGYGARDMKDIGNKVGSVTKMAAPIAATMIGGPAAGTAVSGIQQIGSQFNPADQSQEYPTMRMGGSQPCYDCGGMHYAMGGVTQLPGGGYGDGTGQVENDENSVAPNGQFTQFNEPSHDQQNPNVPNASLTAGEKVFSAKLKMPGTKKSFAQLNKANNTNRQDKVLEDSKATSIAVNTAKLLKGIKAQNSDMLFAAQEQLKQDKVKAYARRMGVELPDEQEQVHNPQEEQAEMMTARNGGQYIKSNANPRSKPDYLGGAYSQSTRDINRDRMSGVLPTVIGTGIGAVGGSMVNPGIGTVAGGIAGGIGANRLNKENLAQSKLGDYEYQSELQGYANGGMHTLGYQDPRVTGGIDMTNPSSVQYHNEFGKYEMGGEMDQYKKGGRFMGINPAHKGYCTPMTKPTCTGHRRALALTLKKHHGFHEMGGVQKFEGGGGYIAINPNTSLNLGRTGNQLPYMMNGTNVNYNTQNNVTPFNLDKSKDIKSSSMAGIAPPPSGGSNIPYGDIATGIANLAGPVSYLAGE